VIEAGFPVASTGDFEAVQAIAREVRGPVICGLARANYGDIDRAWEALKEAEHPRIHLFIATSDLHLKYKLQKSRDEVLRLAVDGIKYAKQYTSDVEFSAEDASRSDIDYLCEVVEAAIEAGATVINLPDTVGYSVPSEFGEFIQEIRQRVNNIDKVILSVHCHNDLGLGFDLNQDQFPIQMLITGDILHFDNIYQLIQLLYYLIDHLAITVNNNGHTRYPWFMSLAYR
jgi:2-isopropylmalate synthase